MTMLAFNVSAEADLGKYNLRIGEEFLAQKAQEAGVIKTG